MAKNSLQMVYGYSPNQLVFGSNPKLPNIVTDGPPAWEIGRMSEAMAKHLGALHAARKAFIKSESCSKLKLALKAKIRSNLDTYTNGDIVYYKREKDDRWMGPAKVVFQDGKVIFIRHGAYFVRISANRLVKASEELSKKLVSEQETVDKCNESTEQIEDTAKQNGSEPGYQLEEVSISKEDTENAIKLAMAETDQLKDLD